MSQKKSPLSQEQDTWPGVSHAILFPPALSPWAVTNQSQALTLGWPCIFALHLWLHTLAGGPSRPSKALQPLTLTQSLAELRMLHPDRLQPL